MITPTTQTTTTTTLDELIEKSKGFDASKADYTERVGALSFQLDAAGLERMHLPKQMFGTPVPLALTDWAFNQICAKMGVAAFGRGSTKGLPADYLMALQSKVRAYLLNYHLSDEYFKDSKWFIRANGDTCRAILSESYARIDNTEMLELLGSMVKEQPVPGFRVIRPHVTPDSINIKTIWKDINPNNNGGGNFGIGVYLGNGETGNRKLRLYPMIQRHACDNSIIIEHEGGAEFFHRGLRVTKMLLIKSLFAEIFGIAADALDRMLKAERESIPDFQDVLSGLARRHGWDDSTVITVATGTEGQETRAGLVNGITYAAHRIFGGDDAGGDAMADMEILGGKILFAPPQEFAYLANFRK